MVICPERGADLHMAQLMPLPLTVSCFSKIQIGMRPRPRPERVRPRPDMLENNSVCMSMKTKILAFRT